MLSLVGRGRPETPPTPDAYEIHLVEQAELRKLLMSETSNLPEWFWDEVDVSLLETVGVACPWGVVAEPVPFPGLTASRTAAMGSARAAHGLWRA